MASSSGQSGPAESPGPAAAAAVRDPTDIYFSCFRDFHRIIQRYDECSNSDRFPLDFGDMQEATRENLLNTAREYIDLLLDQRPSGDGAVAEDQRNRGRIYVASIREYRRFLIHSWARDVNDPLPPDDDV